MPPRRSTRAASTNPASKPAPAVAAAAAAAKPAPRSRSHPPKRPASPDTSPAPPAKRSRAAKKDEEHENKPKANGKPASKAKVNGAAPKAKPASKAKPAVKAAPKAKAAAAPKKAPAAVVEIPPINPLPTEPVHLRPGLSLFGWGVSNFGQLGMGPDFLGEYAKPKQNLLVKEKIEEGDFGGEGAGLESVAAGGMHTLFVDEKGRVRTVYSAASRRQH